MHPAPPNGEAPANGEQQPTLDLANPEHVAGFARANGLELLRQAQTGAVNQALLAACVGLLTVDLAQRADSRAKQAKRVLVPATFGRS